MSAPGEALDDRPLVRPEPRRLTGSGILRDPLGARRRGDRDGAARVAPRPLEESLAPRLDAVLAQRLELGGLRCPSDQGPAAERSHHEHADTELLGERQDLALDLALLRVVGHLDRLDAAGPHDLRELAERARAVVRRAGEPDDARVTQLLDVRELAVPRGQVVDLQEVDASAEEAQRAIGLVAALDRRLAPELRRHEGLVATALERRAEHLLGSAVHRRGVEPPRARGQRRVDHAPRAGDGVRAAHVERAPRTHPDDGQARPALAEWAMFHARKRLEARRVPRDVTARRAAPVAPTRPATAAGARRRGVEAQAGDDHVGVTAVRVDRDPAPPTAAAPAHERGRVERLPEETAA